MSTSIIQIITIFITMVEEIFSHPSKTFLENNKDETFDELEYDNFMIFIHYI